MISTGKNCWKYPEAEKMKVFYSSAEYYKIFYSAAKKAEENIIIIGWDIHSRLKLIRDESGLDNEYPVELGPFLNKLAQKNKNLNIYILSWDFAFIYLFEREIFPIINFDWKTHRHVHFVLDNNHPAGASQHQKIVTIDDSLAFIGGIDLGPRRWDTEEHLPDDKRRRDPLGNPYPPFHDMQVMVNGHAAEALSEIARERWKSAGNKEIKTKHKSNNSWPDQIEPDFKNIPIAIARTYPEWKGRKGIKEAEKLHIDSIASAKNYIFMENQYMTSIAVCEALEKKLNEKNGPEVILISTKRQDGWMEENTMGVFRYRFIHRLLESDKYNRLLILYPAIINREHETLIAVHAKITIIDGLFFRVGSANLSNRSMRVDSECDIAIESTDENYLEDKINNILFRLLSLHLSISVENIRKEFSETKSVIRTIKNLQTEEKSLYPLKTGDASFADNFIPEDNPVDPVEPINIDRLIDKLKPDIKQKGKISKILKIAVPVAVLLILAGLWNFTELNNYIQPEKLSPYIMPYKDGVKGFLAVIGIFTAGSIFMIPVTLMIVLTALVFGPLTGFFYALTGSIIAAFFTYLIGKFLWRDIVGKIARDKINVINGRLKSQSVFIIAGIRLVPVAPFTIMNMVAGSSKVKPGIYLLGTLIGMTPGILGLTIFSDRAYAAVKNPDILSVAIAGVVFVFLVVLTIIIKKSIRKVFNSGKDKQ